MANAQTYVLCVYLSLCYCIYPSTPFRFAFHSINFYVIILRCENPIIQIRQLAYMKNCRSLFYSCVGQLRTKILEIYLIRFGNIMVGHQKLLLGHKKRLLLDMIQFVFHREIDALITMTFSFSYTVIVYFGLSIA